MEHEIYELLPNSSDSSEEFAKIVENEADHHYKDPEKDPEKSGGGEQK